MAEYTTNIVLSVQAGTYTFQVLEVPSGYQFDHWEQDGVNLGNANPITIVVEANSVVTIVLVAVAPPPTYTLSVQSTPVQGVNFSIT